MPKKLARILRKLTRTVKESLTVRGWKIRPKVWIENEKVETNKGYFARKGDRK